MKRLSLAAWSSEPPAPLPWHDDLMLCFGRGYAPERVAKFAASLAEGVNFWDQTLRTWPEPTPRARRAEVLSELRGRSASLRQALLAMPPDIALDVGLQARSVASRDPALCAILIRAALLPEFEMRGYHIGRGQIRRTSVRDAGALLAALLELLDAAAERVETADAGRANEKVDKRASYLASVLVTAWRDSFGQTPSPTARESSFDKVRRLLAHKTGAAIGQKLVQRVIANGSPLAG